MSNAASDRDDIAIKSVDTEHAEGALPPINRAERRRLPAPRRLSPTEQIVQTLARAQSSRNGIEWVGGNGRGLAVSGCSLAADGALSCGDWADIFTNRDVPGAVLTIGDAMGYGEEAVGMQRYLRWAARHLLSHNHDVKSTIETLDRLVSRLDDTVATYLVADIDSTAGCLRVHNAGHPPPLLIDHRGVCAFVPAPTAGPLGAGTQCAAPSEVAVTPGSTVVLYTDGLVEHRSEPLEEGLVRLESAARGTHTVPVHWLAHRLLTASLADGRAEDDVTIVVARICPVSEHSEARSDIRAQTMYRGPGSSRGDSNRDADLELPSEGFIRLVYGRLDPDHTTPATNGARQLDELRSVIQAVDTSHSASPAGNPRHSLRTETHDGRGRHPDVYPRRSAA